METYVLELPDPEDGPAHAAALQQFGDWTRRHSREVGAQWILSAAEVMVVAAAETVARLDPSLLRSRHPRTTRWALLANVGGVEDGRGGAVSASSVFAMGAEVVVLWPLEATSERVRVLGEKPCGTQVAVARMPRTMLVHLRVGKLDHPALLYRLGGEAYWPATLEAHQEATRLAYRINLELNDGQRD